MVDFDALTGGAILAAFGERDPVSIVLRPSSPPVDTDRGGAPLRGVFERAQVLVQPIDGGVPTSVPKTTLGLRQSDLPPDYAPFVEARVHVRGLTFDVHDAQPDGLGWIFLELGLIG